jgi:hypothetical protein
VLHDRVTLTCSATAPDASPTPTADVVSVVGAPVVAENVKSRPAEGESGEDKVASVGPWEGYAWAVSARAGFAMLKAAKLTFDGPAGRVDGASLGLHDAAGTSFGLSVAYERPWLFTSLAFDVGYASLADRSIFALSGSSVVAPSLKLGTVSIYGGPAVFAGAHELTVAQGSHFEYVSPFEVGVGAAAGARFHLRQEGSSTGTVGVELSAPVTGHQPLMVLLSFGWGTGH